jgi:hypothetical protein
MQYKYIHFWAISYYVTYFLLYQIFNALDRDIESPQAFRDRLLGENANRDQTDVDSLFEAYLYN